jgi:hypothetical protein
VSSTVEANGSAANGRTLRTRELIERARDGSEAAGGQAWDLLAASEELEIRADRLAEVADELDRRAELKRERDRRYRARKRARGRRQLARSFPTYAVELADGSVWLRDDR